MITRWGIQNTNNTTYQAAQAADAQRRQEIISDPHKTALEKRLALAPLEKAMRERFDSFLKTRAGHEAAIMKEHAAAQPTAQLVRAAFANPGGAYAEYQLFSIASPAEKLAFARLALAENNLVSAFALRRATVVDRMIADEDRDAIQSLVSQVTAREARQADAELLAFRIEAGKLDGLGWDLDIAKHSDKLMDIANTAASLPREDGPPRGLTTREQRELLDLAGVPAPAPVAPPAAAAA